MRKQKKSIINDKTNNKLQTVLNNKGYLIKKTELSDSVLKKLKDELTVTPKTLDIGEAQSFPVFTEDSDHISIPRFYGIEKFGIPVDDKLPENPVDIAFKGNLREYQVNLVNLCLNTLKTKGGGLLCVGCGQGRYLP